MSKSSILHQLKTRIHSHPAINYRDNVYTVRLLTNPALILLLENSWAFCGSIKASLKHLSLLFSYFINEAGII